MCGIKYQLNTQQSRSSEVMRTWVSCSINGLHQKSKMTCLAQDFIENFSLLSVCDSVYIDGHAFARFCL